MLKFKTVQSQEDAQIVYDILWSCALDMQQKLQLHHWVRDIPLYTPQEIFSEAQHKNKIYIAYLLQNEALPKEEAIATFTICEQVPHYCADISWIVPIDANQKFIYFKKLAVFPKYQASGIGAQCVKYIETEIAKQYKAKVVRLACAKNNSKLIQYYVKLGYGICGERIYKDSDLAVIFDKQVL